MQDVSVARARADTYRLLGRLCLAEVDAGLLRALRATPELAASLAGEDEPLLGALRAEYAHLVLFNLPPYESIYLDPQVMLNTDATHAVAAAYGEGEYSPAGQVGAPDHVGLELAFLGHLAAAEAAALERGDARGVQRSRVRQARFLTGHLGRWAPLWACSLTRLARTPFYRSLGEVVREYVLQELERGAQLSPPVARGSGS
jgi:TorA maturation chaperone TorD